MTSATCLLCFFLLTHIQNTPAATDMSVENFVTFSADLTEQDYFNFSVSGKQHMPAIWLSSTSLRTRIVRKLRGGLCGCENNCVNNYTLCLQNMMVASSLVIATCRF